MLYETAKFMKHDGLNTLKYDLNQIDEFFTYSHINVDLLYNQHWKLELCCVKSTELMFFLSFSKMFPILNIHLQFGYALFNIDINPPNSRSRGKSLLELWVTTFLPNWQPPLIFVRFTSKFLCMSTYCAAHAQEVWGKSNKY